MTGKVERYEHMEMSHKRFLERAEQLKGSELTSPQDEIDINSLIEAQKDHHDRILKYIQNRIVTVTNAVSGIPPIVGIADSRKRFEKLFLEFERRIDTRLHAQNVSTNKQGTFQVTLFISLLTTAVFATLWLGLFLRRILQERKRQYGNIKQLAFKLQVLQEDERQKIAREIHDELGQLLTVLKMELFHFSKQIHNPKLKTQVKGFAGSIDDIVKTVRRIASELRPAVIGVGLGACLRVVAP